MKFNAALGGDPLQVSPSARRAWIEIVEMYREEEIPLVALRTEGVD